MYFEVRRNCVMNTAGARNSNRPVCTSARKVRQMSCTCCPVLYKDVVGRLSCTPSQACRQIYRMSGAGWSSIVSITARHLAGIGRNVVFCFLSPAVDCCRGRGDPFNTRQIKTHDQPPGWHAASHEIAKWVRQKRRV